MTQISTETLAATAPAGIVVTEYRGYQLIDNENYVTICRNAAVVQCAHTPEQACGSWNRARRRTRCIALT